MKGPDGEPGRTGWGQSGRVKASRDQLGPVKYSQGQSGSVWCGRSGSVVVGCGQSGPVGVSRSRSGPVGVGRDGSRFLQPSSSVETERSLRAGTWLNMHGPVVRSPAAAAAAASSSPLFLPACRLGGSPEEDTCQTSRAAATQI